MKLLEMNSLGKKYLIRLGLCDSTGIHLSLILLFVYIQRKVDALLSGRWKVSIKKNAAGKCDNQNKLSKPVFSSGLELPFIFGYFPQQRS